MNLKPNIISKNHKKYVKYSSFSELKEELIKLRLQVHKQKGLIALKDRSIQKLSEEIDILRYQLKLKDYTPNTKVYELATISDLKLANEFVQSFYNPFYEIEIIEQDDVYKLIKSKKNNE